MTALGVKLRCLAAGTERIFDLILTSAISRMVGVKRTDPTMVA